MICAVAVIANGCIAEARGRVALVELCDTVEKHRLIWAGEPTRHSIVEPMQQTGARPPTEVALGECPAALPIRSPNEASVNTRSIVSAMSIACPLGSRRQSFPSSRYRPRLVGGRATGLPIARDFRGSLAGRR